MRIGIDTGGTFTDFIAIDGDALLTHKVRSTPDDPSRAMLDGLEWLGARARRRAVMRAHALVHGSTVATNAVLERRGARVALVTTAGFEDVIRIARQDRPELYNVFVRPRPALVDPSLIFGIAERIDADGRVVTPIDGAGLDRLTSTIRDSGAEIAAVCLLHSYANADHEKEIAGRLRGAGLAVCTSSEVLPEYREYERWSTTVVNAAVTPVMDRYLGRLEAAIGSAAHLAIMQSNGGSLSARAARAHAVRTILSGPAGGVVGARAVAAAAGFPRVISFDMGGTSTDVSLIDRRIRTATETTVGDFPVRMPVIDVHTIGAGGGSIAWVDAGGALRVGPRSAGATPGPACYGTSDHFTVTDANLLLGRFDAGLFLGGRMPLDEARAQTAAGPLAAALGLDIPTLAAGVVRVANANMERAVRAVSIERGYDCREFTLAAFGGAGPMHACEMAASLGIHQVLMPRLAGVLSALGMLMTDITRDFAASVLQRATDVTPRELGRRFHILLQRGRAELAAEGFNGARAVLLRSLDVRYAGQSHELTLPFTADYRTRFDRAHEKAYGYADPDRPIEIVAVRVTAVGRTTKPRLPGVPAGARRRAVPVAARDARFGRRSWRTSVYQWETLPPGARLPGPAIVMGGHATGVVPPAWTAHVDRWGNLICAHRSR